MIESKSAFEKACKEYQLKMRNLDLSESAERTGARKLDDTLIIPFFERLYRLSATGVFDPDDNEASPAVAVALYTYLFKSPIKQQPAGDWLTFREFKKSGPLAGYFTANTNRLIASHFAGEFSKLVQAGSSLGAECKMNESAYDLVMTFIALPKVSISLRFNEQDEVLPAQSVMLFQQSAEAYIDLQSMIILGTYLTGHLIRFGNQ